MVNALLPKCTVLLCEYISHVAQHREPKEKVVDLAFTFVFESKANQQLPNKALALGLRDIES